MTELGKKIAILGTSHSVRISRQCNKGSLIEGCPSQYACGMIGLVPAKLRKS